MKKYIISSLLLIAGCFGTTVRADVSLGNRCEAFLPGSFYSSHVIYQSDIDKLMKSKTYGQDQQPSTGKRYWIAFSDRELNTTYNSPSTSSGKYSHLNFNEKVRIAKIEDGFALVYREPDVQSQYPNISDNAETRGWVPMKNLLLWISCPTDAKGIYDKALLAANIDANDKVADMGRVYLNPETRSGENRMKTDMNIYFVMKKGENDLVLLANQAKMDGTSDQVLLGWVSQSSYIHWNQRSCLEPTWEVEDVQYFKGSEATIYADKKMKKRAAGFKFGVTPNTDDETPATHWRMPKEALRFPILDNDTKDTTIYKCTTFGMIGGALNIAVEARKQNLQAIEKVLGKIQNMNLIIVIDGTKSMEPYYPAVKEAIKQGSDFIRDGFTFKVGIVIYRDYADGQYLTEVLPMVTKDDPRLAKFLDDGGKYGIKFAPADRTKEEALYQGIAKGLDCQALGYKPDESNLMVIVGDCGNDEKDTKILPADLERKMIDYKMNLMTFQVRRENTDPYLAFNQQLRTVMMNNIKAQYAKLSANLKPRMVTVADGYDLHSNLNSGKENNNNAEYFVFSVRQAEDGQDMPARTLAVLLKNNLADFANAVQKRIDNVVKGGNSFDFNTDNRDDLEAEVDSAFYIEMIGYERYLEMKKTNTMSAFTGYSSKKDKDGRDYWKPIIYISADEFNNLIQRLEPVNKIARTNSDDRKAYVDAMKALVRSLIPDITDEEMEKKSVGEIMGLIAGLNESSMALRGPSLIDIQDPKVVNHEQYYELVSSFATKYRKLTNIKTKGYRYALNFNNVKYYWIPMEDMP